LAETEKKNVWFIGDQTFDVPDINALKTSGVIQDGRGFLIGQNDASREYIFQFKDFFELEARIKLSSD
jgi:hypothetical protein